MGWSHDHMWQIKIGEEILAADILPAWGARYLSPTPRPPGQGSSAKKRSSHHFWLQKTSVDCGWGRWGGSWIPGIPLKGPMQTYLDSLSLSFSPGAAARKEPGKHGEELNSLASGWGLEGQLPPIRSAGRGHCSFSELSSHSPQRLMRHLRLHKPG